MFNKIRNTSSWKFAVIMGGFGVLTALVILLLSELCGTGIIPSNYGLLPLMILIPYMMISALLTIVWLIIAIRDFCKRKDFTPASPIGKPRLITEILFAGLYILQTLYMIYLFILEFGIKLG